MSVAKVFGFYGLGTMGKRLAAHMKTFSKQQGGSVLVASRNATKAQALSEEIGAGFRPDMNSLAADCDVLALCLSTSKDVESVLKDAPLKSGSLVIDVTSGEPGLTKDLGDLLASKGVRMVDAPVSGGPQGAESGTCVTMLGGADQDMDQAEPVVSSWSSKVVRCGPLGSGDAVKAVNNVMNAAHVLIAVEGCLALQKYGVEPSVALDVINSSSGMSLQSQRLPKHVVSRNFDFGFQLALMRKDCGIAADLVESLTPTSTLIPEVYRLMLAAEQQVGGEVDYTQIAKLLEKRTGGELR